MTIDVTKLIHRGEVDPFLPQAKRLKQHAANESRYYHLSSLLHDYLENDRRSDWDPEFVSTTVADLIDWHTGMPGAVFNEASFAKRLKAVQKTVDAVFVAKLRPEWDEELEEAYQSFCTEMQDCEREGRDRVASGPLQAEDTEGDLGDQPPDPEVEELSPPEELGYRLEDEQIKALAVLAESWSSDLQTTTAIADSVDVDRRTLTPYLEGLRGAGYVEEGRNRKWAITAKGRQALIQKWGPDEKKWREALG